MIRFVFAALVLLAALPARADVAIKEVTSPGGINAWLVEDHAIPFVAIEMRFRGGAALDETGKRGATNLMMALLEEGAGELDSRGFARAVEGLAASFEYDTRDDVVSVSAKMLSENRDEALALLRSSLVAPTFAEADLNRVRAQVISIIQSDQKDPSDISARAFDALVFGDHPYGSSRNGTVESVSALTRDDIVAAHRAALTRDRIYVGAVGDITAEELGPLLDKLFGDLPAEGPPLPPDVDFGLDAGTTVIDFPTNDKHQSNE